MPIRKRVTPGLVEKMQRMRRAGYRPEDIAWEFGVSAATACNYTKGLQPKARGPVRGRNPVDTEREADIIARLRGDGRPPENMTQVAESYGISRERVRQIVRTYEARTGETIPRRNETAQPLVLARRESPARMMLRHATLIPETGCWHWTGVVYVTPNGRTYPRYTHNRYAHRLSYEWWRGEIPEDKRVYATCGDRLCINPYHLDLRAPLDALRESESWDDERNMWKHTPPRKRGTHCRSGLHELTPENTYEWRHPKGYVLRRCRACQRRNRRKTLD
jgi:hypothetical protein